MTGIQAASLCHPHSKHLKWFPCFIVVGYQLERFTLWPPGFSHHILPVGNERKTAAGWSGKSREECLQGHDVKEGCCRVFLCARSAGETLPLC